MTRAEALLALDAAILAAEAAFPRMGASRLLSASRQRYSSSALWSANLTVEWAYIDYCMVVVEEEGSKKQEAGSGEPKPLDMPEQ